MREKTVLITGSTDGVGRRVALEFGKRRREELRALGWVCGLRGQYWVDRGAFEAAYSDFGEAIVFA